MEEVLMSTSIFLEEREFLAHIHEVMIDEDNSLFRLTFPDITGCVAEGRSLFDAIEEARERLVDRLMSMKEANEKIPSAKHYSGESYVPVRVIFAD